LGYKMIEIAFDSINNTLQFVYRSAFLA